jgi:hypothetical protein
MPLLIENLGFTMSGAYSLLQLDLQVSEHGRIVPTTAGPYFLYAPGEGIEIWSTREAEDKPGHLRPHFSGGARIRVAVVERRPYVKNALADGVFVAYFKHKEGEGIESVHERLRYGDGTYTGVIPFVFSAPDYHCYEGLQLPVVTDVEIAAFPFQMIAYETEDDWIDSQLEAEKRRAREEAVEEDDDPSFLAGASFLPSTMLFEKQSPDDFPQPTAHVSGFVLETAILTNPATQQDFSWARIETAAGEMDLIVCPELLDGYLVEGGVAVGHCYLSGRLHAHAPKIEALRYSEELRSR